MKKIKYILSTILALPAVLAGGGWNKTGDCGFYGSKGGSWIIGWGLLKLLGVAVFAFIISAIFWWTYKWIVLNKKSTKRKKK